MRPRRGPARRRLIQTAERGPEPRTTKTPSSGRGRRRPRSGPVRAAASAPRPRSDPASRGPPSAPRCARSGPHARPAHRPDRPERPDRQQVDRPEAEREGEDHGLEQELDSAVTAMASDPGIAENLVQAIPAAAIDRERPEPDGKDRGEDVDHKGGRKEKTAWRRTWVGSSCAFGAWRARIAAWLWSARQVCHFPCKAVARVPARMRQ
jgi:hypothetical protein